MNKGKYRFQPNYSLADAVMPEARPGYKAGNELVDSIADMIKGTQKRMKNFIPGIESSIDYIIKNKIKEEKDIEQLLDTLLSLRLMGLGERQFNRLNKYYSKINKKNAEAYLRLYTE
jgi:hypothetical protein